MDQLELRVGPLRFQAVATGPADGPVVLLLHGFPQTSWCWRGVWPALAEAGFRVVAPDQRGYSPGARPLAVADYAMPRLVDDALGMLDALGAPRAHLVGHDWGAAVAWQLAARHPDRLRSLTAVSVPHPKAFVEALESDPDQRERSAYMRFFALPDEPERALLADDAAGLRAVFDGADGRADVQHYVARMSEPGVLTAGLNWYRAQRRSDSDTVPPVTVPTRYVWSDGDVALGPVAAQRTAAQVSGPYEFEVLAGISHWVPEQAADQLARSILAQLHAHP